MVQGDTILAEASIYHTLVFLQDVIDGALEKVPIEPGDEILRNEVLRAMRHHSIEACPTTTGGEVVVDQAREWVVLRPMRALVKIF